MNARVVVIAIVAAIASQGCGQNLDSFLYKRTRVEAYDIPAEGDTPLETVSPDRIEVVRIPVNDEVSLGAVYITANVAPPLGYVLYFHGQCCNLNEHVSRMKLTANLGYDVLGMDYRGWGTSTDVAPTEEGILEDARASLAYFTARTGVPKERMTYYGRSFGSAVATKLASVESPAVLVLESALASVEAFKTDATRMDFPAQFLSEQTWDSVANVQQTTAAVLLFHGLADDFVRPEFSERIYEAASDPKKLVLVPEADHGDVPDRLGDEYREILQGWIDAHTPP